MEIRWRSLEYVLTFLNNIFGMYAKLDECIVSSISQKRVKIIVTLYYCNKNTNT